MLLAVTTSASGLKDTFEFLEKTVIHWRAKNWNDKLFYFDRNINPLYGTLAKRFYKMLSKKVAKVEG